MKKIQTKRNLHNLKQSANHLLQKDTNPKTTYKTNQSLEQIRKVKSDAVPDELPSSKLMKSAERSEIQPEDGKLKSECD